MKKLVYYLKQVVMNPRKIIRLLLFFLLASAVMTACKKDEPEEIQPDSSPVQQLSKDDNSVEGRLATARRYISRTSDLRGKFQNGNSMWSNIGFYCGDERYHYSLPYLRRA